jgi:poly(hydroxyalkanoate) granule-associated protein
MAIGYAAERQKPTRDRQTGARRHTTSRKAGKEEKMTAKKKAKQFQNEVADNAHQIWLAGLGAVATAQEEGGKLFKNLVEKGQSFEKAGKDQVEKAKGAVTGVKVVAESYWETFERTLDEKVTSVIHRIGVPTKDEIDTLTAKVENLTAAIDKLRAKEAPKPRTRSAASKPKAAATKKTSTATKTTKKTASK